MCVTVQVALPAKQQKLVMPRVATFHATTPRYPAVIYWCLVAPLLTVAHLTENDETAAQTAVTASTYPLVVLSAQHADLNCMIT